MLVITCVSSAYACGMKGEGFSPFRSSNFRLFSLNPQPIEFSGILLAKRHFFLYIFLEDQSAWNHTILITKQCASLSQEMHIVWLSI